VRIPLNKMLLWRWIADLRAEKNELAMRIGQLQEALQKLRLPPILITTMPKSGTYYISKLFTQGLFIDSRIVSHQYFPYDVIRQPELRVFAQGNMVSQDHFGASKINLVHIAKHVDRMVVHVRDPRQAMLSYVHYLATPRFRREEDETRLFIYPPMPDDFYQFDLEARIDWAIENWLPLLVEWTEEWVAAAETLYRPRIKFTRYEDLVADRDRFVQDVLEFFRIPVERYFPPSIEPDEDIHFRKGEVAEWMTAFTPKQAAAASAKIPLGLATQFGWSVEGVPSASIR
jgi:Sulfotransferase domain